MRTAAVFPADAVGFNGDEPTSTTSGNLAVTRVYGDVPALVLALETEGSRSSAEAENDALGKAVWLVVGVVGPVVPS